VGSTKAEFVRMALPSLGHGHRCALLAATPLAEKQVWEKNKEQIRAKNGARRMLKRNISQRRTHLVHMKEKT
jgi:hypothetical protein